MKIESLIEKTPFIQIFGGWITLIVLFGIIFSLGDSKLASKEEISLEEGFYLSFSLSAASVGYTNITPVGKGRVIAMIEVILSLMIYGIAISKLVSVKQETILEEVYKISFDEHVNRLRSMLYVCRSDLSRIIEKIAEKRASNAKIMESSIYIQTLSNAMADIEKLLHHNKKDSTYVKKLDFMTFEVLINSMNVSMEKVGEFFNALNEHRISVDREVFTIHLGSIYETSRWIIASYGEIDDIKIKKKLEILGSLNKKIKDMISEGERAKEKN